MTIRTDIDYPTSQNMIEAARQELEAAGRLPAASIGGFSDLTFIGPLPLAVRRFKGKAFVTIKVSVPAGTVKLKTVIEQYEGAGPTVDVIQRKTDDEKEVPETITATGGVFTFEFGAGLAFNATYGSPKLVATLFDDSRVKNWPVDKPESPRLLADYLPDSLFTIPPYIETTASYPELGLIIRNELYEATQAFDAQLILVSYAPTTGTPVAYTGTVTTTVNSNIVIGTITFVGQVVVGQQIIIATHQRLVTGVSGTQLTVDFNFITAGAGLSMTIVTLMTFGEAQFEKISHRFRLENDPDAKQFGIPHDLTDADKLATFVQTVTNEFQAAEQYRWLMNRYIGGIDERLEAFPPSPVLFVAGDNVGNLALLTSAEFLYGDETGESRDVSFVLTQPNPPVGLDEGNLYRRNDGDGTVSISGTSCGGIGTSFLDDFDERDQIVSAGQVFDVISVSTDIFMTLDHAASPSITGQPYQVSKFKERRNLRKRKYHPPTGGEVPIIPLRTVSTQKLTDYDFVFVITAANQTTREFIDSFTTDGSGALESDTDSPNDGNTLDAPDVYFEPGKGIIVDWIVTALSQMNTHLYNSIRVGNSDETLFLDISTKTLISDTELSKKQIHKGSHSIVSITRRKLRDLFGPTAIIKIRYFITNSIGETGSFATSLDLATMLETMTETGLETDATIPAKTMALTTANMITGGGMFASKDAYDTSGATNTLGLEWRDTPNRTTGTRINTVASKGLTWVKATHCVEVATNVFTLGGELCCKLPRQILPGETWSLWFLMNTKAGSWTMNAFTMSLYDEGNTADIDGTPITKNSGDPVPIIVTTTYKPIIAIFDVAGTYVLSTSNKRQWLRLKFGANPSQILQIDKVCLVRNAVAMPWSVSGDDVGVDADADPSGDTGSGSVGATGGTGNIGSGGGGVGPGEGGQLVY